MDEQNYIEEKVYDRLILSGMAELEEHGLADFSLRRAAQRAQVSCAAPYRHFKDKEAYIQAIVEYVHAKWVLLSREIERSFSQDAKRRAIELCIAQVRFRLGNPHVPSVLSLAASRDEVSFDDSVVRAVEDYATAAGLGAHACRLKVFAVRAILAGVLSLLPAYGEDDILALLREALERELITSP